MFFDGNRPKPFERFEMIITVCNFKGGTGKTAISLNLALSMDYSIVTNDIYSPLEKILPENRLTKLDAVKAIPNILSNEKNIIFDLGGHIDSRATDAMQLSRWILVPTTGDFIDLQVTMNFISEIYPQYNKNLMIIANRTIGGEYEEIKEAVQRFFHFPVFEIKKSKSIPYIFRERRSIREMVSDGGLKRHLYSPVARQFDAIIKHMEKYG